MIGNRIYLRGRGPEGRTYVVESAARRDGYYLLYDFTDDLFFEEHYLYFCKRRPDNASTTPTEETSSPEAAEKCRTLAGEKTYQSSEDLFDFLMGRRQ